MHWYNAVGGSSTMLLLTPGSMIDDSYTFSFENLAYAIMNKMDPGIKVLFKEKEYQDITDLVTEIIYNTDSQNFVSIVSEKEYPILLKQILELNLDLPSRVWMFVSTKPDTSIWHQISDLCCRINVYVIGQLQRKEGINGTRADIIAAQLHLLSKRETVIDYIIPWSGYSGIIILAKQEARQHFNFSSAFTLGLWSTVGLTFILSCFLVFLFIKALNNARTYNNGQEGEGQNYNIDFKDVVWFLVSSSAFEGTRKIPKGHSIRILIAGFWIFINILMSVFLGNVAAFLMSSSLKVEINSFSDLIKQNTFQFSCWRDSSVEAHIHDMSHIEDHMHDVWTRVNLDNKTFSTADQTVWTHPLGDKYTKLWHGIVKSGFVNTTGEAVDRIMDENYMFITDSAIAEFLATDDCNLKTIGRKISARPYGFGIRKHSSLKENISRAYLDLQHLSEMHEIRRRWWKVRNDCPVGYDDKRMNLSEMAGCFFTVLFGSVLGIFVLNIEYFISKCKVRRKCTVFTDK
ncbi:hypothetical protein FSP39_018958 [Pinctada imbricata]|uniref:Ionotropic glutamate receptor C-terminal domain-containing protein n=1 Tax=Pinctada imbricata TaxID=66713 RepID=A0AA88XZX0_PINIB|nr:hypothetical protein FSP39_018958 [Pinctada imbricata]